MTAAEIFEKRRHGVALLFTFDVRGKPLARASGVVLSADGIIATNAHTLEDASVVEVRVDDHTYPVEAVLDEDSDSDVCILKVSAQNLPVVALADHLPPVGSEVVAIGNPLGYELTVSKGVLSGIRDDVTRAELWLQHTAPISHGSSGGALFDEYGDVVGLTTQYRADGQNMNFAIAADTVKEARRRAGIRQEPPTVRVLTLSRIPLIVKAMASAVSEKDVEKLVTLADRLSHVRLDDAHAVVSLGIVGYIKNDYATAIEMLVLATNASLEPTWSRTAKAYLAAARERQMRSRSADAARKETLEAIEQFLNTSPPSLLEDADDKDFVEWARGVQRRLTGDNTDERVGKAQEASDANETAGSPPQLSVQLLGDRGYPFAGTCRIMLAGVERWERFAGSVPATFTFPANVIGCEFHKQARPGLLQAQIVRDGKWLRQATTSDPFGSVLLQVGIEPSQPR